jgi:transposase
LVKRYRPYAPTQVHLLPPSPEEWLPEGHLAYFVMDLVEGLDLGAIEDELQRKDARGERPYSPRMMTALLLYGYAIGVFSSRRIERATFEDVPFRVLAAGEHPHFTTVNGFRQRHRAALAGLFGQVLKECQSAGLVKLGHVAIDGTKMKANASKHKAMSHERMLKEEARLTAEAEALLAKADAVDAAEDELYGVGQAPQDLPAELQRREARKAKIREVREALQREAAESRAAQLRQQADELRQKAEDPATSSKKQGEFTTKAKQRDSEAKQLDGKDGDEPPPPPAPDDDLPLHRPRTTKDGTPHPKAQRNFTDPESKIMPRDGTFLQAYNAQAAVDDAHQIIVAAALSNQSPDAEYFGPMLERIVDNCNGVPETVTADAGYFSAANVAAAERMGAEPFISVGKHSNDGTALPTTDAPKNLHTELREGMRGLLNSPRGKAIYARRKATIEPVFGQIRACRGFGHFSFRGLFKNRCEWLFVCLTHNLLKLFRAARAAEALQLAAA